MRRLGYQVAAAVFAVAAIGPTSASALASSTATPPDAAVYASTVAQVLHQTSNVEVRVPPALVSSSDGLPSTLSAGSTYQIALPVWLAAGQPQTDARLDIVGAQVSRCGRMRLVAGAVTTLRCRVVPSTSAVASGLTIRVVIDVHQTGVPVTATFTHHVQPLAPN